MSEIEDNPFHENSASGRLIYFNPSAFGGLADYAHEQANALVREGCDVIMVCPSAFVPRSSSLYERREFPVRDRGESRSAFMIARAIRMARDSLLAWSALAAAIDDVSARTVLLGAYSEYFSPFWSSRFRAFNRRGVVFGAVVHDPIRDVVLGPKWWHRMSVRKAYSFLDRLFVHEPVRPEVLGSNREIPITRIPHGPYRFAKPAADRETTRARIGIPSGAFAWIAFGHIRDNKNLDLAIRALREFPTAHLIVAGRELSSREKPGDFYQGLARSLGVADRCHWMIRHIPDEEAASLFQAADGVLLNYSATFKSASGVLAAAVGFRKPCVASSGAGPLRRLVEDYRLGPWVEPDSLDALLEGMRQISSWSAKPEWNRFEAENSWERNAQTVISSLGLAISKQRAG